MDSRMVVWGKPEPVIHGDASGWQRRVICDCGSVWVCEVEKCDQNEVQFNKAGVFSGGDGVGEGFAGVKT